MSENNKQSIISEDYADILIEYNGDDRVLNRFPGATIRVINILYAVVHIPVDMLTFDFLAKWGLAVLPKLYGLISQSSVEASGIERIRSIPNFDLRGQGVLIGILDTGIDYINSVFRNEDGTTRIASIWDQTIQSDDAPKGFDYGTEYTKEKINNALLSDNPLEIVPSIDENGHGTMVAGIAAGNEVPEQNFYGIATESDLVIVKLKQAKQSLSNFFEIPENVVCYSEVDILFGLQYLVKVSSELGKPIVLCIALGSSYGGHDGRGILSNTLSIIGIRDGTGVVIAAGNEGNARRHYFGIVDLTIGYDTVELLVGENESGFVLELWANSPSFYSIDITSPSGEYVPIISANINASTEISFIFEQTKISVLYEIAENQSGAQVIAIRFSQPSAGLWRFNVYQKGDINLGFHMWLPMGDFLSDETYFIKSNNYTTILSPGNARIPITVTAYNDLDDSLYLYASRGYTRLDRVKPTIAAPGVNVIGPDLKNGFQAFSGTSVSAAHTAGVVAMMLEWGIVKGNIPRMTTVEIMKLIIRGARRKTDLEYPNREWGYGILDLFNLYDAIRIVL